MEVILIKDVDNLGGANELVSVRPGYARNYLIPQKFAVEASSGNKKMLQERQKVAHKREEKLMAEIAKVTEVLKASPVKLGAKLVCVQVTKQGVTPAPPGGGPGPGPDSGATFLEYKLKCPQGTVPPAAFTDQLGGGTFTPKAAKTFLVPAN